MKHYPRAFLPLLPALLLAAGCSTEGTVFDRIGKDNKTWQDGYREGYKRGQADQAKREYWVTQNRQAWGTEKTEQKNVRYYTFPAETATPDGRQLQSQNVTVPIVEPER
jgi:hypothetical protein